MVVLNLRIPPKGIREIGVTRDRTVMHQHRQQKGYPARVPERKTSGFLVQQREYTSEKEGPVRYQEDKISPIAHLN